MAILRRKFYWHHMMIDVKWHVKTLECQGAIYDLPREAKSKVRSPFAPWEGRLWRSKVQGCLGDMTRASRD